MRVLRYSDDGDQDLFAITLRIAVESGSREIAKAFEQKIHSHCSLLASLPGTLGTARPELGSGIRSTPSQGYTIFFRYVGDVLEVLHILHASRDVISHFDEG
jgi:toxin ParE1/3/4